MSIKEQIEQDLKKALLANDKVRANALKSIKNAVLNTEITQGSRQTGLSDKEMISVLKKESKKLQESIQLYEQAGDQQRLEKEKTEKEIIDEYLPRQLNEEEINELIDKAIEEHGDVSPKTMGKIIGYVQQQSQGAADGSKVASLVKGRISG